MLLSHELEVLFDLCKVRFWIIISSLMLASWSSVSSRNNVLFVVASTFTTSHILCKVLRFLILLPRQVEVVERMTC